MITSTYKLMKCDRISYFSVDHDAGELVCEVSKDAKGARVMIGQGIIGHVAKTGKATIVNDVANDAQWSDSIDMTTHLKLVILVRTGKTVRIDDPYSDRRFYREFDKRTNFKTKSIMACPISDRSGRRVGVIEALNKQNGVFTETDEKVLDTIACEIGEVLRSFETQTMLAKFIEEHGGLAEWLQ